MYAVSPPYANMTNSGIQAATQNSPLSDTYFNSTGKDVDALLTQQVVSQLSISLTFPVLAHGDYLSTIQRSKPTTTDASTSSSPVLTIALAVVFSLLFVVLIVGVLVVRRRREKEREAKLARLLNARKSLGVDELGFRVANPELQPESTIQTFSGGEVDPETGQAFFYKTTEELKTVNTPMFRGTGGDNKFSSTTTKIITDEKHWLVKREPEDESEFKAVVYSPEEEAAAEFMHTAVSRQPIMEEDENAKDSSDPWATLTGLDQNFTNPLFGDDDPAPSLTRRAPMSSIPDISPVSTPKLERKGKANRGVRDTSQSQTEKEFKQMFQSYLSG